MTDELSLEQLLRRGNKVRQWKQEERSVNSQSFLGICRGITVRSYGFAYACKDVYGISAHLDKIELSREQYVEDRYGDELPQGNPQIKGFYESIRSKYEKQVEREAEKRKKKEERARKMVR